MDAPRIDEIDTRAGPGRLFTWSAARPTAHLLLGHGAGGGVDSFDLAALADALPARGTTVTLFEQPWRTAGRKVAPAPKQLDLAWRAALGVLTPAAPLLVGGRSAGARVALRCADEGAVAVVALSFPLHPPGRPERTRLPELAGVTLPVLVLQGDRDPFGRAEEVRTAAAELPGVVVVAVEGADHGLGPRRRSDDADARASLLVSHVADFVARVVR